MKKIAVVIAASLLLLACTSIQELLPIPQAPTPTKVTIPTIQVQVPTVQIPTVQIPTVQIPTVQIPTIQIPPVAQATKAPEPTKPAAPTSAPVVTVIPTLAPAVPTATSQSSLQVATPVPSAATAVPTLPPSSVALYDNFSNGAFDNTVNPQLWLMPLTVGGCNVIGNAQVQARQINKELVINSNCPGPKYEFQITRGNRTLENMKAFETRFMVDKNFPNTSGQFQIVISGNERGGNWQTQCIVEIGGGTPTIALACPNSPLAVLNRGTFYTVRMEMNPQSGETSYFLNGELRGKYASPTTSLLNNLTPGYNLMNLGPDALPTIHISEVRVSP
jgi:hypothetical protein